MNKLAFRNKKCQELLDLESDEVKAAVQKAWVASASLELDGGEEGSGDNA